MLCIMLAIMGLFIMLAMSGISVYGVMLAGWASGSKYPLLSSVRSSAQMISYEAALGMLVVTVVMITGSLSTRAIVDAQAGAFWHWNLIRLGVVPFFLFFIAITAEINHPPFDVVEAEMLLDGGRLLPEPVQKGLLGLGERGHSAYSGFALSRATS